MKKRRWFGLGALLLGALLGHAAVTRKWSPDLSTEEKKADPPGKAPEKGLERFPPRPTLWEKFTQETPAWRVDRDESVMLMNYYKNLHWKIILMMRHTQNK